MSGVGHGHMTQGLQRLEALDPMAQELLVVVLCLTWVLGVKFQPSAQCVLLTNKSPLQPLCFWAYSPVLSHVIPEPNTSAGALLTQIHTSDNKIPTPTTDARNSPFIT